MSILTHICLSGQSVHSKDSVSTVTYANLVFPSEMNESEPIIFDEFKEFVTHFLFCAVVCPLREAGQLPSFLRNVFT